jgi:hypothetical protein
LYYQGSAILHISGDLYYQGSAILHISGDLYYQGSSDASMPIYQNDVTLSIAITSYFVLFVLESLYRLWTTHLSIA